MNPKIKYYLNRNKCYEEYLNDLGQYHNEFGPAYISFYENGNKVSETYCINGQWHNTTGPAYIRYDMNGKIEYKQYFLNDEFIDVKTDEEFRKYINRLNIS